MNSLSWGKVMGPDVRELLTEGNFAALREVFSEWSPADLAELIQDLDDDLEAVVFRLLPHTLATSVFEYLPHESQEILLQALGKEEVAQIINSISPDDRTALLEELPSEITRQLIQLLTPEKKAVTQSLLAYPENSVGRLMTPHYVSVRSEWTIQEALDHIRKTGKDSETLNLIYVVDAHNHLIDDVRIRKFLLSDPHTKVADLVDGNHTYLEVNEDRESAVKKIQKAGLVALPVKDNHGALVGIVTVDDILEVAEQAATEDIQKIGGTEALDQPYMETPMLEMIKKRAGWLIVLFIGEMFTATAMGFFENELEKAVVLALFVPLIISSGGNSGSQAATLIIRAMALGEITFRDWWRVMRKEFQCGFCLGAILGTIGFIRIALWSVFSNIYGPHSILVATTVGAALIGIVMWGSLMGSMLPILLKRCGADPATSSAPFVATLVDVTGLVIYFSVAYLILHGTLL
ncbi:MAG: magnesium transporter [Verrucomicrobiota bacterium]